MNQLTGRLVGYLVAGAVGVGLLLYTFNQLDGLFGGNQEAATSSNSRSRIALHDASVRWHKKLKDAEQRIQQQASASHALASELRTALANGTRIDTIQVLVEVARADSTAFVQCSVALRTCQQRAESAEQDADSLKTALQRQLKVRDHKCGVYIGAGYDIQRRQSFNVSLGCRLFRLPLLP